MNAKHQKYRNVKTSFDGVTYDSKAEARHAKRLKLLGKAINPSQRVVRVERQVKYELTAGISYRADFRVTFADGHVEVHEVKGFETREWMIKKKLFGQYYPDVILKVVK